MRCCPRRPQGFGSLIVEIGGVHVEVQIWPTCSETHRSATAGCRIAHGKPTPVPADGPVIRRYSARNVASRCGLSSDSRRRPAGCRDRSSPAGWPKPRAPTDSLPATPTGSWRRSRALLRWAAVRPRSPSAGRVSIRRLRRDSAQIGAWNGFPSCSDLVGRRELREGLAHELGPASADGSRHPRVAVRTGTAALRSRALPARLQRTPRSRRRCGYHVRAGDYRRRQGCSSAPRRLVFGERGRRWSGGSYRRNLRRSPRVASVRKMLLVSGVSHGRHAHSRRLVGVQGFVERDAGAVTA